MWRTPGVWHKRLSLSRVLQGFSPKMMMNTTIFSQRCLTSPRMFKTVTASHQSLRSYNKKENFSWRHTLKSKCPCNRLPPWSTSVPTAQQYNQNINLTEMMLHSKKSTHTTQQYIRSHSKHSHIPWRTSTGTGFSCSLFLPTAFWRK